MLCIIYTMPLLFTTIIVMRRFYLGILIAILPVSFLGLLVFAPMWALLNLDNATPMWAEIWQDSYYHHRFIWTVIQALTTVGLTLILGLPIAWTLTRLDFIGRELILRLLMLPFIMPTLVAGMGVLVLFGERGIIWHGWANTPALLLYGNVFFNLPVMVRAIYQGLCTIPSNRLAVAQVLGAKTWQRFIYVEWPAIGVWIISAACLIFLYCFSGFGLALLLGGQQYTTVEVDIYQLIAYELDISRASVLVWFVLAVTALTGGLAAYFSRKQHSAEIRHFVLKHANTRGTQMLLCLSMMILLFCCALPLVAIIWQAIKAKEAWGVIIDKETLHALWNTVRFSSMAMILAAILGLLHAALARRLGAMRTLTFLPFMVSPVCLSFGVLLLYPQWVAQWPMLVALYALLAYPFVTKDVLARWDSLPQHYFAAARTLGATSTQVWWHVTFPLLLPAMRRGLTLAAATCIGEFAASLFLSRPEWTTLTTLIYHYLSKVGVQNHDKAIVLTLLLMCLSGLIFLALDSKEKH